MNKIDVAVLTRLNHNKLPVPPVSREIEDLRNSSDIETAYLGVKALPEPFNTADCFVGCLSAHPHVDEQWKGQAFICLALKHCDHGFGFTDDVGDAVELSAVGGSLFVIDPMRLHWVRPNNGFVNPGFLSLQWEVPVANLEEKYAEILAAIQSYAP